MATQRRYSIEFKRQIVQEYQGGESLHGLAKRHGISRNLVRIWAAKAEAGEFDDDLAAASILQEYEARIGALERLVGKLALENEFLKGASRHVRQPASATISVIAGLGCVKPRDRDPAYWAVLPKCEYAITVDEATALAVIFGEHGELPAQRLR